MTRYDDLAAFSAVVREGSFTRAAAQMGVTQSALSQTIRTLERRLNLKLLNRTTRSVSPTEAGERLYVTVGPRFADIDAELAALSESRDTPTGTVRITASETAARTLVWPRLQPLLSKYPSIKVEVSSENRFVDIVAERFDIGVRLGGEVAKDMIAVRMTPDMRMTVVGSPDYFERRPQPRTPQELSEHDCICLRLPTHRALLHWEFKRRGKTTNVQATGRLVFNATDMVIDAAMAGHGLAWVPVAVVNERLAAGRLTAVLEDWAIAYPGHHLYYASRSASPVLALVVEALRVPQVR